MKLPDLHLIFKWGLNGTLGSEFVGKFLGFEEMGLSVGEQRGEKKRIFY
jgi:hypothetical protein